MRDAAGERHGLHAPNEHHLVLLEDRPEELAAGVVRVHGHLALPVHGVVRASGTVDADLPGRINNTHVLESPTRVSLIYALV